MKFLVTGLILALALGTVSYSGAATRCRTGEAQAFVAIQREPLYLVGTIPSSFTLNQNYFSRRYSCKGNPPAVRRVSLGLYDVLFPGLDPQVVLVTALSDEGVSASVWPVGNGIVRVALRGPLGGADVATRRDVPFSVAVF